MNDASPVVSNTALLDALDRLEWEEGMQYRRESRTA